MRISIFLLLLIFIGCTSKPESKINNPVFFKYQVRGSFPHDRQAFTQGFTIHEGELFESTGQDSSWIGIVDINTGKADKKVVLDNEYFGEGITILNNKVYQLTYKHKKGFVYDLKTFEKINEFNYPTEGWGLTDDGTSLIMSDGTSYLYFIDTTELKIRRKLNVTYNDKPINALNELEYVNGFIYANVWQTQWIAKIDAATGEIKGFLDLTPVVQQTALINPSADVMNGIAWYESTQLLLITGKYWPYIYAIKIQDA